jgi:hypothetical protein
MVTVKNKDNDTVIVFDNEDVYTGVIFRKGVPAGLFIFNDEQTAIDYKADKYFAKNLAGLFGGIIGILSTILFYWIAGAL